MSLEVAVILTAARCLATWVADPTEQTAEMLAASFGPLFVGWVCDCSSTVNDGEAAVHTKFGYLITEFSGFALAAYDESAFTETEKKVFFGALAFLQTANASKDLILSFFSARAVGDGGRDNNDGQDQGGYLEF